MRPTTAPPVIVRVATVPGGTGTTGPGLLVFVGGPGGVVGGVTGVAVALVGVAQAAVPEVGGGGTDPAVVAGRAEACIDMGFAAKRRER